MNSFYRIVDPGHSWLRVPMAEVERLNLEGSITAFSKARGKYAYLEEDVDMQTFIKAREDAGLPEIKITDYVCKRNSRLRNYDAFPQAEAPAPEPEVAEPEVAEPEVAESATDEDDGSIPFETEVETA